MGFKKALRENIWLKILMSGSSGSGKTYSALRVATGIAKILGEKIAAIDTENGRIRYYANEFDFDDVKLEAPYTPEKYIEQINIAVDSNYKILIIDSISHEWTYCYETVNKMPGNSYTNWGKMTPRHDAFMEKILQSPLHVIATVRGKDEYLLEDKEGKKVPKKVGLGYKQRDDVEYEYTVTFNIDQKTHIADITKDNTHLFENKYEVLTEKDGEELYKWANSGIQVEKKPKEKTQELDHTQSIEETEMLDLEECKALIDKAISEIKSVDGFDREIIKETIKANNINSKGKRSANYNEIQDLEVAQNVLEALVELQKSLV
jgi:hypothetical protein